MYWKKAEISPEAIFDSVQSSLKSSVFQVIFETEEPKVVQNQMLPHLCIYCDVSVCTGAQDKLQFYIASMVFEKQALQFFPESVLLCPSQ